MLHNVTSDATLCYIQCINLISFGLLAVHCIQKLQLNGGLIMQSKIFELSKENYSIKVVMLLAGDRVDARIITSIKDQERVASNDFFVKRIGDVLEKIKYKYRHGYTVNRDMQILIFEDIEVQGAQRVLNEVITHINLGIEQLFESLTTAQKVFESIELF